MDVYGYMYIRLGDILNNYGDLVMTRDSDVTLNVN